MITYKIIIDIFLVPYFDSGSPPYCHCVTAYHLRLVYRKVSPGRQQLWYVKNILYCSRDAGGYLDLLFCHNEKAGRSKFLFIVVAVIIILSLSCKIDTCNLT